jgi:hypothetical protein
MPSRRLSRILVSLVAVLLLLAAARAVMGGGDAGLVSELEQQLVLVSPQSGQMSALSSAPLTVHTELPVPGAGRYLASGSPESVTQVRASGLTIEVLDADTRGKVYYFVERGVGDEAAVSSRGKVVYQDDSLLLLALAKRNEAAFLAIAAAHKPHIELLTNDAVPLAAPALPAAALAPAAADPAIASLLTRVSQATLSGVIADLSGERSVTIGGKTMTLQTRYSFAAQMNDALQYVREAFGRMGLSVQNVNWAYGQYRGVNLVADLRGEVNPERIWVIGGHLDDRSQSSYTRAPGADDNASGISAMLAIADILSRQRLRDTVRFVAFTGEEQGMWGSKSYAPSLRAAGAQIMGYIDLDMIGYDSNDDRVIELHSGTRQGSIDLANAFIGANDRYGTGLVIEHKQSSASRFSDHSSFWDAGYSAIMGIENFFVDTRAADRNPWYHNTGDLLSRVRLSYVERYTRAALATMLELAGLLTGPAPTATPTATATVTRTATQTRTATATATRTATPAPGQQTCRDMLLNGNMEAATGWSFGATARRADYVASPVFSGARSLRAGIVAPTADRRAYSSAYQRVTIPANAVSAVLTAQTWRGTADGSGDRQEILLLNTRYGLLRTLQRNLGGDSAWQSVRFDLTAYRGQSVVVYFNVYNDGDGRRSWMYVDDAALQVCTP